MANHGIFLGWNRPITGREAEAGEIFQQSIGYWTKLQKDGMIENFEPVLIDRHGGDLNGFFLIRGERDKLNTIMGTDEYKDLMMRVDYAVGGFGAIPVALGQELETQMTNWMKLVTR
jgi:hypothetical protein